MKISEIAKLLNAQIVAGKEAADTQVYSACGSDLMSDVLAFVKDQALLLTGLVNGQVVRTAEMMDIKAIVFVRGKKPTQEVIALANEYKIALLCTELPMYPACGVLYENGLHPGKVS